MLNFSQAFSSEISFFFLSFGWMSLTSAHLSVFVSDILPHTARDEHLSAIALVARAAPSATVPLLAMLISERCTWLPQVLS